MKVSIIIGICMLLLIVGCDSGEPMLTQHLESFETSCVVYCGNSSMTSTDCYFYDYIRENNFTNLNCTVEVTEIRKGRFVFE